nr:hypothetical protein [Tanacetum cinerariifolium]
MPDLEDSTVTYTEVSSPFEDLSDIGSLKVVVYGYDGLPMHPPSPDYVPGPKHPPSPDYVPGPEHSPSLVYVPYVPEPAYPEFIPPEDDVLPALEQPLPAADPEEDPADYPIDRDDDADEEESSRDDVNDEEDDEDEEEEEEHLAPTDFVPPPTYHTTARMSIRAHTPIPFPHHLQEHTTFTYTITYIVTTIASTSTDCKADVLKVTLPRQKRLCIALGPRFEDLNEIAEEILATNMAELSKRMTDFVTTVRHDTYEIYGRLDDTQDDRLLMSGQLNSLHRDRCSYARTARLMESEAKASCEAWKMAPKRTTRSTPATTTTTTLVTNAQLKTLINQGVTDALATRDADKIQNGVVGLTQWFKRMETVFNISNCAVKIQVKFATCTLHGIALTWWKSHVKTVGQDAAHNMPWSTLMKMITANYTQRFQELALMCGRMFLEESDKIEKYVDGLPDMIHGSVMISKPKIMQDALEFATELMDKKICTFTERQTKNKKKSEDNSRNNQNQQQQNKSQNTGRAYSVGSGEKKPYRGSKTLCSKCNYHHDGPCAPKCHKFNRVGHLARDSRSHRNANTTNNERDTRVGMLLSYLILVPIGVLCNTLKPVVCNGMLNIRGHYFTVQ